MNARVIRHCVMFRGWAICCLGMIPIEFIPHGVDCLRLLGQVLHSGLLMLELTGVEEWKSAVTGMISQRCCEGLYDLKP